MEIALILTVIVGCPIVAVAVPTLAIIWYGLHQRARLEREINTREQRVAHLLTVTTQDLGPGQHVTLVTGSIVYAPDAAARNSHRWRRLFGGKSGSMGRRVESARRLATVRALEQASQLGARAVLNLRHETSELHQSRSRSRRPSLVEIVAYGTAWLPARGSPETLTS